MTLLWSLVLSLASNSPISTLCYLLDGLFLLGDFLDSFLDQPSVTLDDSFSNKVSSGSGLGPVSLLIGGCSTPKYISPDAILGSISPSLSP